jgi:CheY-like chemotaxis protein
MASLAMEKYLVLLVEDAAYGCLSIRVRREQGGGHSFVGNICDGHELIAYLQKPEGNGESTEVPLSDLLLLGMMMPQEKGFGMVQWLQGQPFEGLTVVVLGDEAESAEEGRSVERSWPG